MDACPLLPAVPGPLPAPEAGHAEPLYLSAPRPSRDMAREAGKNAPAPACDRHDARPLPVTVALRVRLANGPAERAGALALRRAVFCGEQAVFADSDRDAIDDEADFLVAVPLSAGATAAPVLGTVRIHRDAPRRWWGSRLAVDRLWRGHGRLGAGLIRLAVATANARGCDEFLAHVQAQNEPLFRRLGWTTLARESLHGRAHCLMRADLAAFPPHPDPATGERLLARRAR